MVAIGPGTKYQRGNATLAEYRRTWERRLAASNRREWIDRLRAVAAGPVECPPDEADTLRTLLDLADEYVLVKRRGAA
jgi:hypothetical protein